MQIEPDTKIVQTDFGCQTSLKSSQVVRTLTSQAKGIQELVIDGFDDLSNACQPPTQGFGPANPFDFLMRRSHQIHLMLLLPASSRSLSGKAFVSHIGALSGQSCTGQTRRWGLSSSKQGFGQRLIVSTGGSEAKAGNHPERSHTQQQMEAFVPANASAPANVGLTRKPSYTTSLGITRHGSRTIEHLIGTALGLHELHQVQSKGRDGITMRTHELVELSAIRQIWKGCPQMMLRIPIKGAFAGKLHPLPKQGQGNHFAALQGGGASWTLFLALQLRLAKIIDHDVQCCQEGIQIDHQLAPFLGNEVIC